MLKKRIMAFTFAAALTIGSISSVFAAGSLTKNVTVTEDSIEYYDVESDLEETEAFKTLEEEEPEIAKLLTDVNEGTLDMTEFIESLTDMMDSITDEDAKAALEDTIEQLDGKEFVTGFFDAVALEPAEQEEDEKYHCPINIPSITEELENIQALHYSITRGIWEVSDVEDLNYEDKTMTLVFEDLSPVAIICDTVEEEES